MTVKVQFISQFQRCAVGIGPLSKWRDCWRRLRSLSTQAQEPQKKPQGLSSRGVIMSDPAACWGRVEGIGSGRIRREANRVNPIARG